MKQKVKMGLLFIFVLIFLIFHPTPGIAQFRVVPLGEILDLDMANVGRDGSLVIAEKGLC